MKYSRLPQEELVKLEKEFVNFLVVNGITAEEWRDIQRDYSRSERIIEAFSDVIWEGLLQRSSYLVKIHNRLLFAFYFGSHKAQLITASSPIDLPEVDLWLQASDLILHYQEKPYADTRELEMFRLILEGGQFSDPNVYRSLAMALAQSSG